MTYRKFPTIVFLTILLVATGYMAYSAQASLALTMSNSSYIINMGNLNSFAGNKSNAFYKLSDTGGQLGPGLYSGTNYKVRAGFQYVRSARQQRFAFSLSNTLIDFGTLSANNPISRTTTLTVSSNASHGYQVTAMENHPISLPANGTSIPNTSCDNGLCTATTSDIWISPTTYGLGYRCDNISEVNCASGFSPNYYKQFSSSPSATIIMSGTTGINLQSIISYKINIATTQPPGLYTNTIIYVATPTF